MFVLESPKDQRTLLEDIAVAGRSGCCRGGVAVAVLQILLESNLQGLMPLQLNVRTCSFSDI